MKYLIVGAGGTGGILAFQLKKHNRDVTVIARNKHLQAIQRDGLCVFHQWEQKEEKVEIDALDMTHYTEYPDVIFVCVKGYSLSECIPFLQSVSRPETIIIPVLNIYGTGKKLQEHLDAQVLDGCIYVSAYISSYGHIYQGAPILRVFYGLRDHTMHVPILEKIEKDLNDCGIEAHYTEAIQREALQKFSSVSTSGAVGVYYDCTAGDFQKNGKPRDLLIAMVKEIMQLADAMGYPIDPDTVRMNCNIQAALAPDATTSMQRDIMAGRKSEVDGLVYEVLRLADEYGLSLPAYQKVADEFRKRGYR